VRNIRQSLALDNSLSSTCFSAEKAGIAGLCWHFGEVTSIEGSAISYSKNSIIPQEK
jgi:hypothetical protein